MREPGSIRERTGEIRRLRLQRIGGVHLARRDRPVRLRLGREARARPGIEVEPVDEAAPAELPPTVMCAGITLKGEWYGGVLLAYPLALADQAARLALGIDNAYWHVALAGLTVFLSWTFMQTMFALHYAHEYYIDRNGKPAGGLDFPGDEKPDYWDFVYFAIVIGASAQTADVSITSKIIRRLVTLHSTVAFFFNAIILALTISIGAGLFE